MAENTAVFEQWFREERHCGRTPACDPYEAKAIFLAGHDSRDAELAALKAEKERAESQSIPDGLIIQAQAAKIVGLEHQYRLACESEQRLREVVEIVEWVFNIHKERHCPWCGRKEHYGHADDCQRQAALGGKS